jgi:pimeloyl-ACP methyl ester carboxylesterase
VSAGLAWSKTETARGLTCRVVVGGEGPDLVFLHGAGGIVEGDDLLRRLAETHRVWAPELPGFGDSAGEELLEDMLDFTLHGFDLLRALGLDRPVLVGHSLGGMIAAEMACLCPDQLSALVLLAPLGLWLDEMPVADLFSVLPQDLPALLFHDPDVGRDILTRGSDFSDDDALIEFFVANARRLGTAGKLMFPIPDRRLSKRLYRLRTDTLLVWGGSDRVVPPVYAKAWKERIPGAQVAVLDGAGHMLTVEKPDEVAAALGQWPGIQPNG